MAQEEKALENIRLKRFFAVVRFFAFAAVFAVGLLFIFKIEFFPFIVHPRLFLWLLLGMTAFSAMFYFLVAPRTTKKITLYANNIAWAAFLSGVLYATGGTWSPWSILLLFPILTTAFDLEAAAAVVVGAVVIAGVATLTTFEYLSGKPGVLSLGLFHMLYLGLYIFYIYRIITETLRQKYEKEETKRKYGELLEIDRAKSDFITITSHQLRTPLTEIRWASDTMLREKEKVPENLRLLMEKNSESVGRLVNIVDAIIKIPGLERKKAELTKTRFDGREFLQEIIGRLASFAARKEVRIELVVPQQVEIFGDREKLGIAVEHLVDNAIRYSPKGKVLVALFAGEGQINIRVQDSGIGISREDYERIFTRFFRAKNAVLLEPDGTGIGLFVAKAIMEKHQGTLAFVSQVGKGTTFTITLPAS